MKVIFSADFHSSISAVNSIEGMIHYMSNVKGPIGLLEKNLQKIDSINYLSKKVRIYIISWLLLYHIC
jgi:hypothetical protein